MDSIVAIPNGLLEKHTCAAAVIFCMDFRFWEATLVGFVKTQLGVDTCDVLVEPGCTKFFLEGREPFADHLKETIALSLRLHHPEQIILVHHSTCGAYGIADAGLESTKQKADVRAARSLLQELFPHVRIRAIFANAKTKNEIAYEEVA